MLKAKLKGGGPKIVLETDYSNIHVRSRGSEGEQGTKAEFEPGAKRAKGARQAEAVR